MTGPVWSGQDQLIGAVKWIKMCIMEGLLTHGTTFGRWPKLDRICGEFYVFYSHCKYQHNHKADWEYYQRISRHYGSPGLKKRPQELLSGKTGFIRARNIFRTDFMFNLIFILVLRALALLSALWLLDVGNAL